jgi:hypothetical protein
MRLTDVRKKAASLGFVIPGDDEQYVISCCGRTLHICDSEVYRETIRLLKEHHG